MAHFRYPFRYEDIIVNETKYVPDEEWDEILDSRETDRRYLVLLNEKGFGHLLYIDSKKGYIEYVPESKRLKTDIREY